MFKTSSYWKFLVHSVVAVGLLGGVMGCGLLADTDRIVVAELDGKNITRGKLFNIIYDKPDDERPRIQSRQDYLRVLNEHIDKEIKIPLGQRLADEGKIEIPRDLAREMYFQSIGDEQEQRTQRHMWSIPVPKPGEESDLMRVYDLTPEAIQFKKDVVDQGTDKFMEKMLGDQAVAFLAMEAYQAGELTLDEETLRLEYEMAKDNYQTLEQLTILGLQFPADKAGASADAAKVRERLKQGEDFDTVFNEYIARDISLGVESVIENNPEVDRFKGFWLEASGAEVGEVRGPVFMPSYTRMKQNEQNEVEQAIVPECYLVFKVLEHQPATVKPFEEAVPLIAPAVAYTAMMDRLREEHGVVIYEDKLPNPSGGNSVLLQR